MRVPLSWLREYVEVDLPAAELAHRLTMAGVEVGDTIETGGWRECFVGQVLTVQPHPQADRLRLCRVTTNVEELEVVCGAPNVAAGQKVCFAKVGAVLYNSHSGKQEALKPARIRGVVSQGMICSELELGLGEDHNGIVVLPEDAPVGTPLDQYLGDTILDLELTPNRLDCLSFLGVAHETQGLPARGGGALGFEGYPDGLTPREVEVLCLVARGRSSRQIAQELVLSVRTVERHISNIYAKINAHNRAEATAYAMKQVLIV